MLILDLTRVWAEPHAGLPHAVRGMFAVGLLSDAEASGWSMRGTVSAPVEPLPGLGDGRPSRIGEPGVESGLSRLFTSDDDVLAAGGGPTTASRSHEEGTGDSGLACPGKIVDLTGVGVPTQGRYALRTARPASTQHTDAVQIGSSSKTEDAARARGDAVTERGETATAAALRRAGTTVKSPVPDRTPDQHTDAAEGIGGASAEHASR